MSEPLQKGQDVSWKWGSSNIAGTVDEVVTEGQAQVESNKGNTITRNAREGDPAVKIARKGNDVVKLAHELNEVKSGELEG
ncbi:hypothetical protein EDB84DRAFT_1273967 [Lactarius hengduanensis]|nr:hypothetical protein EDB85DRAFT_400878 [Lactarius pseudohatsudake]KAH9024227.1 hypothetical protein EDB84DRAFT_1273967 [Lactarius hengduanensis]KAH9051180.1 hypothetical protein EDB83DRAFT_2226279 [Lactarius deliciosus]KAH9173189.1 hypothetical protein EDB89DRAFT_1960344 [Lactarius sanguifluus]